MVGNDIIDLTKARETSNWEHSRFLDKVFTATEKEAIKNSEDPFQCIWRLWSMKESAYKIYVQQFRAPFFNPKKINCKQINSKKGSVIIKNETYTTLSKTTSSYIYTTAFSSESINSFSKKIKIPEKKQRKKSHFQLLKMFSKLHQLDLSALKIKKCCLGIPSIYYKNKKLQHSISITHHGKFGGIIFEKKKDYPKLIE